MTPKIDYRLLGKAIEFYTAGDWKYVEVPWAVERHFIDATLDPFFFNPMAIGSKALDGNIERIYSGDDCLVGSAEQGFLSLELPPGRYVGVTPCFRNEEVTDLFYQDMFMKVELFDNRPNATVDDVLADADQFFVHQGAVTRVLETAEGKDLMLASTEIGSYGERTHPDFGRWVYGTGLALPRFSVAAALGRILS